MVHFLIATLLKKPLPIIVALIAILIFIFGMVVYLDKSVERKTDKVADVVTQMISKFKQGEITTTFTSEWIEISKSNHLEVAKMVSTETIKREDLSTLGLTESEVTVPATYRYHIKLSKDWYIEKRNNICLVIAPKIWPTLPVGFNTREVKKKTESGWARFNKDENLNKLEKEISSRLAYQSIQNKAFIKDKARESVADFVKNWLMDQGEWKDGLFSTIVVKFSDEITKEELIKIKENKLKPTIELSGRKENSPRKVLKTRKND